MPGHVSRPQADCVVVGASFAGLARAGMHVSVLEKKADPGEKLHTTGIIVKDAVDQVALLDDLPPELIHRINGVRLYAPNLRHVDLAAPGYYFLATDTPRVMRWLAGRAEQAGARIAWRKSFGEAARIQSGFDLGDAGTTRFLVGADGPGSRVARTLGLGQSTKFLFGIEHEYEGVEKAFVRSYPRFRTKRPLRYLFDHFQSDTLFNLLPGTRPMRAAAGIVYFHRKGVFNPSGSAGSNRTDEDAGESTTRVSGRTRS